MALHSLDGINNSKNDRPEFVHDSSFFFLLKNKSLDFNEKEIKIL
jgi:hypothetical protein